MRRTLKGQTDCPEVANPEKNALDKPMELDAIVLGAGPAGLSTAAALARRGGSVAVIEPAGRAGGAIRTVREDGWRVELGPNTLQLESEDDTRLFAALGIAGEMLDADARGGRRLIAHGGELHALTSDPRSLLGSRLLSFRGKLRLIGEVFRPRGGFAGETVRAFTERRFGPEAADRLLDPVINGIYAGDPGRLEVEHAFPLLARVEHEHRSVILGLRRAAGASRRRIAQFPGGLARVVEALVGQLPPGALRLGATPTLIRRDPRGWDVAWRSADGSEDGARARHLVIAAPPWQWATLPVGETLRAVLPEAELVEAPPVALVVRGYDRSQVRHPLDAFGVLIPRGEQRRVLGVLFPSSVFPDSTPEGKVQLATFIGGARAPALGRLGDAELRKLVDEELAGLLGAQGAPEREWIARWPRAIPQYTHGHGRFLAAMDAAEAKHPGLRFVGSYRGGVSLMSTLRRGAELGSALARG